MRRLILLLVPWSLVACGAEPPTVAPLDSEPNIPTNRDVPDFRVLQSQETFGLLVVDPVTDVFSILAASDQPLGCDVSPTLYTFADLQGMLAKPEEPVATAINVLTQTHDVHIVAFGGFTGWRASGFDCVDLARRRIAEGLGRVTYTHDDLPVFLGSYDVARTFGFVAHGTLDVVGGWPRVGQTGYTSFSTCVWDGRDIGSMECVDRSRLLL